MTLLFTSTPERGVVWARLFAEAGEAIVVGEDAVTDPAEISHIACWQPPKNLLRYPNLKVVISIGAGVDQMPPLPPGVALSRTIARGIEEMVRDWVVMATLMLHREVPRYLEQASRSQWAPHAARLARTRRVGIMGLGRVGRIVAQSLVVLGFPVAGWSRSGAPVVGIEVFGQDALPEFLGRTDLLICLLPLTAATQGVLNAELFAALPSGAGLVHAGRGAHLDMDALREALDAGHLSAAMVDVTDPEPLPADHWAWTEPRVLVTPHVASHTDAEEGARHALAVIRASGTGEAIPGCVDVSRGY